MNALNYKHLYYFYVVAKEGSIVAASQRLHLTPQTISGQITGFESRIGFNLFDRIGKTLQLSEMGRLIFSYAEEIFQLGDELKTVLETKEPVHWLTFTVGVSGVIPKVLAYQLLSPALQMSEPIRLICKEGDQDSLLSELAVNKLDLVLTDQPLQARSHVKAYSHHLTESGFTFFAHKELAESCTDNFPDSLSGKPFLLQGKNTAVRQRLASWFEKHGIHPNIIAEFDDTALMKSFGEEGYGIFTSPTLIERTIESHYRVEIIGRTDEIKEHYYVITPDRRIKHPAVVEIVDAATQASQQPV